MLLPRRLVRSNFFIKLKSWEYWPFGIIQFPLFIYFIWLCFRARSVTFFSGSNPGIVMGGLFGESKYDVLKKIPAEYTPKTILIEQPITKHHLLEQLKQFGFTLPVIFKPDLGERGFMVKRINTESDIETYLEGMKHNFLIQEFVDLPVELGVFYTRFPRKDRGTVTSVVMKEMLFIEGNGKSTIKELILEKERAKLQWNTLKELHRDKLDKILERGRRLELVSIGNHCLGTKFLDGGYLINEKLSSTFDEISKKIDGFYFGRFDLRCNSINDLYAGNIKILELNGCGAEPAHIYQPGYSLIKASIVLINHWKNIFLIAKQNADLGFRFITAREALAYYKKFKTTTRKSLH